MIIDLSTGVFPACLLFIIFAILGILFTKWFKSEKRYTILLYEAFALGFVVSSVFSPFIVIVILLIM